MRVLSVSTLSAAALLLMAAPLQAEPVVLEPASGWNVNFGADRCRLTRLFTDGTDEHLLFFEQHWPGNGTGVTVAGRRLRHFKNEAATEVQTAEGRAPLGTRPFKAEIERFDYALVYSNLNLGRGEINLELPGPEGGVPLLDTDFASGIAYLSFKQGSREVRFRTGPLGEPFKVLNQCAMDLIGEWGLDVEKHRTAQRLPIWTNEAEIVRKIKESYPLAARTKGEQGIMRMRVIVNEAGRVEDCTILKATTTERLESPACEAMADAVFEPALDAQGKPMRSYEVNSITYRIG